MLFESGKAVKTFTQWEKENPERAEICRADFKVKLLICRSEVRERFSFRYVVELIVHKQHAHHLQHLQRRGSRKNSITKQNHHPIGVTVRMVMFLYLILLLQVAIYYAESYGTHINSAVGIEIAVYKAAVTGAAELVKLVVYSAPGLALVL